VTLNTFAPIDPKLFDPSPELRNSPDGHGGYTARLQAADTPDALRMACGAANRDFPASLWVEPGDRADKARENDKNHTWAVNYIDRFTMQDPTHECTCHSLRTNFECAWNVTRGIIYPDGPKKDYRYAESSRGSVWVSPLSIYAEANPREWGGANVIQVLDIACRRGFLPDKIQPHDYGFKHYLQGTAGRGNTNQSHGPWVALRNFPEGWQETAKRLMPEEVVVTTNPDKALSLILNGRAFSVGRDGHAIPYAFWNEREQAVGYVDSYNVIRFDSMRKFRQAVSYGGFSIISVKAPDDWMDPAGNKTKSAA
jgi:hypothetical protein